MNKKIVYLIILGIVTIIGVMAFFYRSKTNENSQNENYNSTRTSQYSSSSNTEDLTYNEQNNENTPQESLTANEEKTKEKPKETEIASFTTKIYTKDSDRQNNISLACSALNNTTVENDKTFSFSDTVGKATSSKGYKKADVFKNGQVTEALGGGLCQVSTTLYNAILKVKNAKVTERHEHSNKVPYIQEGKDAAVSYGTYDFKFLNNTGSTLKIKATNTKNDVTIKIIKSD